MSSSDEIKDLLDEWLGGFDELDPDDVADGCIDPLAIDPKAFGNWKRRRKLKLPNGQVERVFENTVVRRNALVIDNDVRGWLVDSNHPHAFVLKTDPTNAPCGLLCVVTDLKCFRSNGHASDWHKDYLAFPHGFYEEMEGVFEVAGMTEDQARAALISLGFEEDPAFTNFMSKHL